MLAERAGLRIHEVPVDWTDDTDSRVNIVDTALEDLRGMARVGLGLARGTIKVPPLALRESVYRKPAALAAPARSPPRRGPSMSAATATVKIGPRPRPRAG